MWYMNIRENMIVFYMDMQWFDMICKCAPNDIDAFRWQTRIASRHASIQCWRLPVARKSLHPWTLWVKTIQKLKTALRAVFAAGTEVGDEHVTSRLQIFGAHFFSKVRSRIKHVKLRRHILCKWCALWCNNDQRKGASLSSLAKLQLHRHTSHTDPTLWVSLFILVLHSSMETRARYTSVPRTAHLLWQRKGLPAFYRGLNEFAALI